MNKFDSKTREELIQELEENQKVQAVLLGFLGLPSMDLTMSTLKENHERTKYLMAAAHAAWWIIDMTDDRIYFDDRKATDIGYPIERFKKYQDFMVLLHPDDCDSVSQVMKEYMAGKRDRYDVEYRIKTAWDEYIWLRDVGSIISKKPDGTVLKIGGIVIDINERKAAEDESRQRTLQLQESIAEKDKFFSIIAHDLRSPLNSFLGLTNLMMDEMNNMSLENIQEMAKMMNSSAYNLYRLLDNLLEWSKMKRGMIAIEPELIRLSAEVQDAISHFSVTAAKKQIVIHLLIDEDLLVYIDRNMLRSIVRNIIYNALKFTYRGGRVDIEAHMQDDGFVVTEVKDNGMGMTQDMLSNLFKLDVNTKRLGTEDEPTTGLGLILCKDFVEANGGKMWVTSEEGKGSSFYFSLPSFSAQNRE